MHSDAFESTSYHVEYAPSANDVSHIVRGDTDNQNFALTFVIVINT